MKRALTLARRGQGRVEPNPMVGCVLARRGRVLAEGWHRQFGGPHAEADALRRADDAGVNVHGCDAFVTLEPCSHVGKTPPCADALIDAGVGRVVVAMRDPFPKVAGRGLRRLKRAGIEVVANVLRDEAERLNEAYIKRVTTGLPWVIAKWAQTLDGRIATSTGDSKWISNAKSRRRVHQLRARIDAIVVGIGTVEKDDPMLTARDVPIKRPARRVVIDPSLNLSPNCALVQSLADGAPPVTIATANRLTKDTAGRKGRLEAAGVEFVKLPKRPGDRSRLALEPLLRHLAHQHDVTNVLVEGGAGVHGAMFAQGLVDQVQAFVAPKLLGDASSLAAAHGMRVALIADARALDLRSTTRLGDDVLLDYRVART